VRVKVAFVVPRYGDEVFGGAERAAQQLAERLHAQRGWAVEALTTCAVDYRTWDNWYPEGVSELRGVRVHRFASRRGRSPDFDAYSGPVLASPEHASAEQQAGWIERQGPVCPDLLDAIEASDADVVTFHPYLYAPTVLGLPRAGRRAVLHPSAHDEVPIRLPLYRDVFAAARALVFWTHDEQEFTNRTFSVGASPQLVLGLGVDPVPGDAPAASAATGLGDRPYLLCLGRVDDAKGTGPLVRWFAAYKERHPGPLALVLAGPVVTPPVPHPDVVLTGPVDERTKWGLLAAAEVNVVPSRHESFSIVLLEGWTVGRPALVNGACAVTRTHAARSGGGLWFGDYAHFEVALERLTTSASLRARLGAAGRDYAAREYGWPQLIDRYASFLEDVAGFDT
jgi:glycosyltransferase involved in cell wall biosynthesis